MSAPRQSVARYVVLVPQTIDELAMLVRQQAFNLLAVVALGHPRWDDEVDTKRPSVDRRGDLRQRLLDLLGRVACTAPDADAASAAYGRDGISGVTEAKDGVIVAEAVANLGVQSCGGMCSLLMPRRA